MHDIIPDIIEIELDLTQIEVDMIFQNYRVFCKKLGLKPAEGGRNQRIQKDNILRFLDFEKIEGTQKIRILEIFITPKPIQDGRSEGGRSKYINYAVPLILDMIYYKAINECINDVYSITFSTKDIMLSIGLCNESYFNGYGVSEEEKSKFNEESFKLKTYSILKDIVNNALKRLVRDNKIVSSSKALHVFESKEKKFRPATKEEIDVHTKIKKEVLEELGISSEGKVRVSRKTSLFYEKINKRMHDEFDNFSLYIYLLQIVPHLEDIETKDYFLDEKTKKELKTELNSLVRQSIITSLTNKRDRDKEKLEQNLCPRCLEHKSNKITLDEYWRPYVCFKCLNADFIVSAENVRNQINLVDDLIKIDDDSIYNEDEELIDNKIAI